MSDPLNFGILTATPIDKFSFNEPGQPIRPRPRFIVVTDDQGEEHAINPDHVTRLRASLTNGHDWTVIVQRNFHVLVPLPMHDVITLLTPQ